jgi:hypothetical protein
MADVDMTTKERDAAFAGKPAPSVEGPWSALEVRGSDTRPVWTFDGTKMIRLASNELEIQSSGS